MGAGDDLQAQAARGRARGSRRPPDERHGGDQLALARARDGDGPFDFVRKVGGWLSGASLARRVGLPKCSGESTSFEGGLRRRTRAWVI